MSEKKNIDRLFQEKFKDFEVAPPENLWQNIEAELQKKKKKRVIPLWFMLSGAAAILIIGLLVLFPSKGIEGNRNAPVVVSPENNSGTSPAGTVKSTTIDNSIKTEEAVTQTSTEGDKANESVNQSGENNAINTPVKNGKAVSSDKVNAINKNNAVVYGQKQNSQKRDKVKGDKSGKINPATDNQSGYGNEGVAYNDNNKINTAVKNSNATGNNKGNADVNVQQDKLQNEKLLPANNSVNNKEAAIAVIQNNEVKQNIGSTVSDEEKDRIIQENINKNLTNEAVANTVADTTAVVPVENELEKLQKEMEQQKEEEKALADAGNKEKWNVKPQVAPVFYNSFSEGSPIDSQFDSNSKSYDNDLSFGVGIDYALNDRFSIRSGVNNVNLSYSTNGVEFHASLSEQTNNISAKGARANMVVQNADANTDPTPMPTDGFATLAATSAASQTFNGSMIQEMGYIEVPLEMSYKLLNKKFAIEVIGGMSTLFLNNNNVSVMSDQGYKSDIGEAENLNSVSFSANAGIGFKYRFLKMFEASFEPTLKYQVNTFSENAGNFKPYFIGLYSGISFRF